jgi:HAD superfamily hydrolase (TIGR01509 family)
MLKAAVFDMDGVIVDSHPAHKRAWREFLLSIGRCVSDEELNFVLDGRRRDEILRFFLGELSNTQICKYSDRKNELFYAACGDLKLTDGLLDFMYALEQAGVRMAVASSAACSRVDYILERFGIRKRFCTVVSANDVKRGKPDPEIYSRACEKLDALPSATLAIEDAVSGIKAARAAGMKCLGVADSSRAPLLYEAGAEHVIPDFTKIQISDLNEFFGSTNATLR